MYLYGMNPSELKAYFASADLPETMELMPGTRIVHMPGFLETSFAVVENHKDAFENCPAWWRLMRLYEIVSQRTT